MAQGTDLPGLLAAQLADPDTNWSLGTFGAIAEFAHDPDEPAVVNTLSAVTERGGIRIRPLAELRLVASESVTRESWNQRVGLCLPENRCAMNCRQVLTEVGPDRDAIRERDRSAILFDLGLDTFQVDVCVRVADAGLAKELRACCGRPAFAHGSPAMGLILAASPHRVFISRVGRIEVFQPIPPANGKSPEGPHTHVLPKLLQHRRTHAATEPIPQGWVPCAHFYPAHPVKDSLGARRPYEARRDAVFQDLMRCFGDSTLVDLKQRVKMAVSAGADPFAFAVPNDRFARAAIRIGLRQLLAAGGAPAAIAAWQRAHDAMHLDESEIEEAGEAGH